MCLDTHSLLMPIAHIMTLVPDLCIAYLSTVSLPLFLEAPENKADSVFCFQIGELDGHLLMATSDVFN